MKKLAFLSATSALILPSAAFAQSTGTIEVEQAPEIVVTGSRVARGVEGIVIPDTAKAQAALTNEQLLRQSPGQTVLQAINILPGVNFTNNDPFGSSGGNIRIRGFDGNRISLTFDGLPLNDTGNYAIFSNQQLDPELIEQVNVNLGQTDVDSPTASAAGGTINYRTLIPRRELGGRVTASAGDFEFLRMFAMLETGELTEDGLRGWVSASTARNDHFRGTGRIRKQQYNARLYQDLGGGNFLSVAGHFNSNRNNSYRNPNIADIRTALGSPGFIPTTPSFGTPAILGDFSDAQWDLVYGLNRDPSCTRLAAVAGTRQVDTGCGNFYGHNVNPSDTGNVRINFRYALADNLILTVDPSYQYTLATGGGTTQTVEESAFQLGGNNAGSANAAQLASRVGVDLNGDGDVLDQVRIYAPSITNTNRFGLTSSLIWNVTPEHRLRLAYTFDYGRHRQTGEFGFLTADGFPEDLFSGRNGRAISTRQGPTGQLRDRFSIASLNQLSGQYVGRFFENRLRVEVGLRAPFFKRELNQFCFTNSGGANATVGGISTGGGFAVCSPNASLAQLQAINPAFIAPFERDYEFDALLPNIGAVYNFDNGFSVFGSYAKGFSAPRTDNLYRRVNVDIDPETTDAFDAGVRYTRRGIQAQATAWMINYQNRILTTFDPDLGISIDRNVGAVESYGFDGSIAWQPVPELTLYTFASYISAQFQEDLQIGVTSAPTGGATVPAGTPIIAPLRGRMVSETPEWQFGGRVQVNVGPVEFGVSGKYVDDRFATDINDVIVRGYTMFDLDARLSFAQWGLERTYVQFNISNLFDERYIGSIGSQTNAGAICPANATCGGNGSNPSFFPGSPRTFIATLSVGF